ncbi:MAG: hypothetical protein KKB32_06910, partial [Acidobacteria bacterium]|nr:hypothetical protein [Acidobacteriota bacterium]
EFFDRENSSFRLHILISDISVVLAKVKDWQQICRLLNMDLQVIGYRLWVMGKKISLIAVHLLPITHNP